MLAWILFYSLIFVVLVVLNVPLSQQGSLDEDRQSTPGEKDNCQLQQVPFILEIRPFMLFDKLPLSDGRQFVTATKSVSQQVAIANSRFKIFIPVQTCSI